MSLDRQKYPRCHNLWILMFVGEGADLQEAGFDVVDVVDPSNTDHPEGIPIYLVVATRS